MPAEDKTQRDLQVPLQPGTELDTIVGHELPPIPYALPRDGFSGVIWAYLINMGLPDLVGGASLQRLLSIASINDLDNRPFAIAVDFVQEAILEGSAGNAVVDDEIDLGEGETALHRVFTNTHSPTNRRVVVGFYTQQAEDVEGNQESYEVFEITTLRRNDEGGEEIVAQSIIREMTIDPLRRGWRNNTHVLEYATWLDGLDRVQDPMQRLNAAIQAWQERDKTQDQRSPVFGETHAVGMIKPNAVTEFVGF